MSLGEIHPQAAGHNAQDVYIANPEMDQPPYQHHQPEMGGYQRLAQILGLPLSQHVDNVDYNLFQGVQDRASGLPQWYMSDTCENQVPDMQEELRRRDVPVKTEDEMAEEFERHRKEAVQSLKELKKRWRQEEAEEQQKLDAMVGIEQSHLLRTAYELQGGRPRVRKRELPWWLEEMYEVPSDSEEEREIEAREEERKRNPPKISPHGIEMYERWLSLMHQLSDDFSDTKNDQESYFSEDEKDHTTVDFEKFFKPKDQVQGDLRIPASVDSNLPETVKVMVSQLFQQENQKPPIQNKRGLLDVLGFESVRNECSENRTSETKSEASDNETDEEVGFGGLGAIGDISEGGNSRNRSYDEKLAPAWRQTMPEELENTDGAQRDGGTDKVKQIVYVNQISSEASDDEIGGLGMESLQMGTKNESACSGMCI